MAAQNGDGEVVEKNVRLTSKRVDQPTAVKHANGRDYWLMVPSDTGFTFYTYLLGSFGIIGPNPQYVPNDEPIIAPASQNLFSPDGSIFANYTTRTYQNHFSGIRIFDFDRCTGLLSGQSEVNFSPDFARDLQILGYGAAISPNSRFLYLCSWRRVWQFDLWADDLKASAEVVAEYDGHQSPYGSYFYLMQLGPDGRIYINCTNGGGRDARH